MINTHVEESKIGRQIAEQALDFQRFGGFGDSSEGNCIRFFVISKLSKIRIAISRK